ncbi:MAG: hypothetical protein HRT40_03265 [Campylobacteraceae bacterium]|nr:hypothetical protein [Campylobacteraceae bacterium]
MIVTVKKNKNTKLKILSFIILVSMFVAYYFYMRDEYKIPVQKTMAVVKIDSMEIKKKKLAKKLEKIIYKEVESSIDLIGQEFIIDVKVVNNKVLIVCDPDIDISAVTIRYGSLALVKRSIDDIKIAIDLAYLVNSKLDEEKEEKKRMEIQKNEK